MQNPKWKTRYQTNINNYKKERAELIEKFNLYVNDKLDIRSLATQFKSISKYD